jgi:hypothetical protein
MIETPKKLELQVVENDEGHGGGFYVTLGPFETPQAAEVYADALGVALSATKEEPVESV